MNTAGPDGTPDAGADASDETHDPEVIQRVADALEDTEAGEAPAITLDEDAAAQAASLPQRSR